MKLHTVSHHWLHFPYQGASALTQETYLSIAREMVQAHDWAASHNRLRQFYARFEAHGCIVVRTQLAID
ncbi:MAG TPA: hypothetical protein VJB02_05590 [Coxiellaceae bacterium]|nr:hypothetical protein [Coxiellaceae bacterium]